MSKDHRVTVFLSTQVHSDLSAAAEAQGESVGGLIAELAAKEWRSPSFGAFLRRISTQQKEDSSHDE